MTSTEAADTLTIQKEQLVEAFAQWERDFRAGLTKTIEETAALPIKQVAAESADAMWLRLGGAA